ncbi:Rne/Rng family ribonuclease [Coriobacteriia bacterium Es71-Z0120]|uniref:Rne/Rng family ribonuclease n=1 Tax=Parvivirga hydrogeniphila TaxID=2939460 RepID=UPI002261017B|nr:Rne/Rng family ribonuclease [Parvivirga hydrogeniphila]MCL4078969.1 Rne/Rng family ribonuclease [Parvivirga hydrogeniphila]
MADVVREMLISHDAYETRVAIVEDKVLAELYVERPKRSVVGNVYLGKVRDVLPGMQAAFVDIGLGKNAFLYVDEVVLPDDTPEPPKRDIKSLLKPGQQVMVQVIKDPMGTKGARVTTEVTLPGRFAVLMPFAPYVGISRKLPAEERDRLHDIVAPLVPEGMGVIVRTAAAGADAKDLESDIQFLLRLWRRVQHQAREGIAPEIVYTEMDLALRMVRDVFGPDFKRLVVDDKKEHEKVVGFLKRSSPGLVRRVVLHKEREPLFEQYGIGRQVERALHRVVPLPSGGHIAIDKTEALTAIDVNTGSYVGRKNLAETILRTNLEAADEAVRQIRLRDIGGLIVIDFIDMEEQAHRAQVQERLARALERDRTRTRVTEISRLGIVEMTRKNVTDGLYGVLTEPCPMCGGEGRVLSEATRRITVTRRLKEILTTGRSSAYVVSVNPETYALLTGPGDNTVPALRAETGKHLTLLADPDCLPTEVKVLVEGRLGEA